MHRAVRISIVVSETVHNLESLTGVTSHGNVKVNGQGPGGGYVFIWWKGDHSPRHVHVYRDGKLVVKWDLDNNKAMRGNAPRRVTELIKELDAAGVL